jgi:hypothetical protein
MIRRSKIKEIASNYIGAMGALSSISNKSFVSGMPIPEQYPPTHVLVPSTKKIHSQLSTPLKTTTRKIIQTKRGNISQSRDTITVPHITIMGGQKYYENLKRSRR